MIYALPDLSSIPLGFQEETYDPMTMLAEFEKKHFIKMEDNIIELDNLHIIYRVTNGHDLSRDCHYADNFDLPQREVIKDEDSAEAPNVAIFSYGAVGMNLNISIDLAMHLFIQITRTTKAINTDLFMAAMINECGVGYYRDEEGERDEQFIKGYPKWFIPLAKEAEAGSRGSEYYERLLALTDVNQMEMFDDDPYLAEKLSINKAVDRIIEAELPMMAAMPSSYYNPEWGLFGFFHESISHNADLTQAAEEATWEQGWQNQSRELVAKGIRDTHQLNLVHDYLRAIDNLYSVCLNLP